jgi:hypothetical protein
MCCFSFHQNDRVKARVRFISSTRGVGREATPNAEGGELRWKKAPQAGGSRKAVDLSISLQFTSLEQHLVGVKKRKI